MSEVKIIIRTADQTRKAEVAMDRSNNGGDVIQAAVDNWSLPTDTDYFAGQHVVGQGDPARPGAER